MRFRVQLISGVIVAGALLAAVACDSSEPTLTDGSGVATPDAQATIEALARRGQLGTATPTVVPAAALTAAKNFAQAHATTSEDWDQFHSQFDAWRQGLISCEASSVQVQLRGFAGDLSSITEAARALPRPTAVRNLADSLILAAEREEESLRLLRDNWTPNTVLMSESNDPSDNEVFDDLSDQADSGSGEIVSIFEQVNLARSASSALRQEVVDALSDRETRTAPEAVEDVAAFAEAFEALDASWNAFHQGYDAFRSEEGQPSSTQNVSRLGQLVSEFTAIAVAVGTLPVTEATRQVAQTLVQASEDEELALRALRGTFQKDGGSGESSSEESFENSFDEFGSEGGAEFTAGDPSLFDAFDAQLVRSNGARRQARQELADVQQDISEDTQVVVAEFITQYGLLLRQWDDFHSAYDQWRRTEGGCDRAKAVDTLGRFAVSFGELASDVRGLPSATVLRPLGEILVEAAEREERALRELRDTWRPFDVEVFRPLERERNVAGKLRRQVAVGIQELLEQYGISS